LIAGARPPLRVLFCGCEGLFSALVLRQLLACGDIEVVGVVLSTRLLKARYGFLRGAWHQVRQSGLAYALYLWVATTWTEVLARCAVRCLTRRHAIPNLATRNINDATGLAFAAAARPDALISAFFNQRIGDDLLRVPSIAALNVHPSLLPEFKGVDPVFFARLHGAPRLGVTVHHLERELDTGRILVQETLVVPEGESLFRTTARLFALGGCLLVSRLALPLTRQSGYPQPGCGRYDSWPNAAEVVRLRRRGIALVRACDLAWARRLRAGEGVDIGPPWEREP
jgi:methionyl-tRNA formyltransferase